MATVTVKTVRVGTDNSEHPLGGVDCVGLFSDDQIFVFLTATTNDDDGSTTFQIPDAGTGAVVLPAAVTDDDVALVAGSPNVVVVEPDQTVKVLFVADLAQEVQKLKEAVGSASGGLVKGLADLSDKVLKLDTSVDERIEAAKEELRRDLPQLAGSLDFFDAPKPVPATPVPAPTH